MQRYNKKERKPSTSFPFDFKFNPILTFCNVSHYYLCHFAYILSANSIKLLQKVTIGTTDTNSSSEQDTQQQEYQSG